MPGGPAQRQPVEPVRVPMADGRELLYFDDEPGKPHELEDQRDLPPISTSSEVRHDPLLDEWVSIASHRQSRTYLPPTDECPLCPSTPERSTEVPSYAYDVVVFENRFPSFAMRVPELGGGPTLPHVERRPGRGQCEVVCFTSDHTSSFSELTPQRIATVMDAWAHRTAELTALEPVQYVFCFENRGEEIGVTLAHPHGQIYGYPFIPPRARQVLESARRQRDGTGGCLFTDVLASERRGERVVASNEHWTAFVPGAARWPFEVHLYPHRKMPDLAALDPDERAGFGPIYLEVLSRFDGLFGAPVPYIAAWNQAPAKVDRDLGYLHLEIFSIRRAAGKLKYLAGSESGMGAFVNDIVPEQAAQMLREVKP